VLQDRVVVPIGSRRQVRVDVRIVAATHQDLENMVREGRFRQDLYYRLRELEIVLPSLRERLEDLPRLTARFLSEAAEELGYTDVPEVSVDAAERLGAHRWPGNIRELRHVIKGAALRSGGEAIRVVDLDLDRPSLESAPATDGRQVMGLEQVPPKDDDLKTWKERLEAQEKAVLQRTYSEANGNLTKAAEMFGVPRTTYREKLVRHGLLEA
jgi:Nif-specific regulatory protein